MPNWCYNQMTVRGNTSDLRAFVESIYVPANETEKTEAKLSLSSLFPIPAELMEYNAPLSARKTGVVNERGLEETVPLTDEEREQVIRDLRTKYGSSDWYDWCCSNWGTKWGDCDTRLDTNESDEHNGVPQLPENTVAIGVYYETAWSPADGLIAEVSRKHPNLLFQVVSTEEAEQFAGWSIFHAGQIIGSGSGEIEPPAEITAKYDEDNIDDYYEALSEWQGERNDAMSSECNKCANHYASAIRIQKEKTRVRILAQIISLNEELSKEMKQSGFAEVLGVLAKDK